MSATLGPELLVQTEERSSDLVHFHTCAHADLLLHAFAQRILVHSGTALAQTFRLSDPSFVRISSALAVCLRIKGAALPADIPFLPGHAATFLARTTSNYQ